MSARKRAAIFASGRGSNAEAIVSAARTGHLPIEVVKVISDRADALVLKRAADWKLPFEYVPVPDRSDAEERRKLHEEEILKCLEPSKPQALILAGYMRVLTPHLIDAFRCPETGRSEIYNVHPSLLPAFPGKNSYQRAFEEGCHTTGVTVHRVEREVDCGPVLAQEAFSIAHCLSADEVERLGLRVEHRLYVETLRQVFLAEHDQKRKS